MSIKVPGKISRFELEIYPALVCEAVSKELYEAGIRFWAEKDSPKKSLQIELTSLEYKKFLGLRFIVSIYD